MRGFDVRVTWSAVSGSFARTHTTVVKVQASTEELALSVARRSVRFEPSIPKDAEVRNIEL
jgi:hypothetical protein